jgi:hypothetical protein
MKAFPFGTTLFSIYNADICVGVGKIAIQIEGRKSEFERYRKRHAVWKRANQPRCAFKINVDRTDPKMVSSPMPTTTLTHPDIAFTI